VQVPVDIRFRHVEPSAALEAAIREHVESLERFSDAITSCHVTVDQLGARRGAGRTGAHHRQGPGAHFRVSIRLHVPGHELFVGKDVADDVTAEDPYAAASQAFEVMKRLLKELKRLPKGSKGVAEAVS
jgi:ribosome-associated translation inhibitor RaiA